MLLWDLSSLIMRAENKRDFKYRQKQQKLVTSCNSVLLMIVFFAVVSISPKVCTEVLLTLRKIIK